MNSVVGDTLIGTLEQPNSNWPIGEQLELRVVQNNRGAVQINSEHFREFSVAPTIDNITPRIGGVIGGAIVTISGTGLYFDRYPIISVSVCDQILTYTSTEIQCVSGTNELDQPTQRVVIRYYLSVDSEARHTVNTGYNFEFRVVTLENINNHFDQNTLHLSVDVGLPTAPINIGAYALEYGDENLITTFLPTSAVCQNAACYTVTLSMPDTTPNNYDIYLTMDNFGKIFLGQFGRGITILGIQFNDGSMNGGHELRLSTTDNMGMVPQNHRVQFKRWGHDLCTADENLDKSYMCQIRASTNNEFIVTTPAMTPHFMGSNTQVNTKVEFRNDGGTNMIHWFDQTGRYSWKRSLTPRVVGISSNDFLVGDELTVTVESFDPGFDSSSVQCSSITIFIGDVECPVSSCASALNTVTCTVSGQPNGDYPLRVNFLRVGDADYSDVAMATVRMRFVVNSVAPLLGSFGGGTLITLQGSGLGGATFNGELCGMSLRNCQFSDDGSQAVCETPNIGAAQTCHFAFYDTDGDIHSRDARTFSFNFDSGSTPIITSISPVMGGSMGGTRVTIDGNQFAPGIQNVTIGSSGCIIKSESTTQIICETEPHVTSTKHRVIVSVTGQGNAASQGSNGEFWYIDRWSSHFTWGCNDTSVTCPNKPVASDIAVIPKGKTILLDETTPILSVLLVQGGTLLWDRSDNITLRAQYVLITDEGHFELGTEEDPFCGAEIENQINAEIEIYGHHRSIKLPIYGSKVFAVRNGTIDIHGCKIDKTWTVINETVEAGSSEIVLKDSVFNQTIPMTSWKIGDEIVIATTAGRLTQRQSERRTISGISSDGYKITLSEPLDYRHLYHKSSWDGKELEVAAEVGLLTRNVKLHGNENDDWIRELPVCHGEYESTENAIQTCYLNKWNDEVGSDQFGVHLLMHYITRGRLSNIEVFHAGQGFQLGRYPLHFHNSGNQPDSYISGNGIHDTFNRAVTMHGVWNATVEWNVAYNCMGHNFFIEDAVEEDLLIQYNLAVKTKQSTSLLSSDQKATAFWITNAYNTIQHNHAAGGAQVGFWVNPPPESGHANADCPPIVRSHCPIFTPVKRWYNNTAHDMGLYGFWIFSLVAGKAFNPSTSDCRPTWPPGNGLFELGKFWNCQRGAEVADGGDNIKLQDFIVANNELGGLSFKESKSWRYGGEYGEYASGIYDGTVIGYVDDTVPELAKCTRFGVETPWKKDGQMKIDGIKFYNFDKPRNDTTPDDITEEDIEWCTAIDACYS